MTIEELKDPTDVLDALSAAHEAGHAYHVRIARRPVRSRDAW